MPRFIGELFIEPQGQLLMINTLPKKYRKNYNGNAWVQYFGKYFVFAFYVVFLRFLCYNISCWVFKQNRKEDLNTLLKRNTKLEVRISMLVVGWPFLFLQKVDIVHFYTCKKWTFWVHKSGQKVDIFISQNWSCFLHYYVNYF